jgi:ribosomal protein S18 acetylase RimI-like enzyme
MGIPDHDNLSADAERRQRAPVLIRIATPDDAPALGDLLASALAAKYGPTLGPKAAEALASVISNDLRGPRHGYWVADRDAAVVGSAHLALAGDSPPRGMTRRLARVVGWRRALWTLAALSVLAHGPLADDEAYVGEVAVEATARRQGIALQIMNRLVVEAARLGKTRMTLLVTTDNAPAIELYTLLGFTPRSTRRWTVGRWIFGSPGATLMEKRIVEPPGGPHGN